ncbi:MULTISPECIES: GspH/FimT family pseudopilin [Halomonadaceae]|jgi:type IV fimbrial biogenesis protein FimT|uniref:Type II secretion system protein H n=1 Tax=Halomonas campaniensis TaxID=213554 RepID=A0A246RUT3_9GAMM|nr:MULTISPECIES: GspH/FimT family pseudopilin [Halomonas]MBS3670700.1 GspH/FimT family pseudopilin [Halomonas boliviensis]OWV27520.1 pilus assembly protein [Halomonas campaniensis]
MVGFHNQARTTPESGFTLLELLVTLLLVGIIAVLGLPNFQALGERTARSSEINRLQSAFAFARNTAISQRQQITLCPANKSRKACANDWSSELMIVRGDKTNSITKDDILRIVPAQQDTQVTYSRGWSRIRYSPLGYTSGYNGSFSVCSSSGAQGSQGKKLVLSQLGRLRIDGTPIDC